MSKFLLVAMLSIVFCGCSIGEESTFVGCYAVEEGQQFPSFANQRS